MVNIFGERLKILRIKKNITQEQLAVMLNINRMTIVKWEKGVSEPTISILRYLANILNVEANYLLGEDDFTLYLIFMAEKFSIGKKQCEIRKNAQIEFAQWIIYCNDFLETRKETDFSKRHFKQKSIDNSVGYKNQDLDLIFPEDYNNFIIDYIIKADYEELFEHSNYLNSVLTDGITIPYNKKNTLYYKLFDLKGKI